MVKDGKKWCLDVFDKFVVAGQSVTLGEAVVRRYRPVSLEHNRIVLGIFSSDGCEQEVYVYSYILGTISTRQLPHIAICVGRVVHSIFSAETNARGMQSIAERSTNNANFGKESNYV